MGVYINGMEMPTFEQRLRTINIYADGVVTNYAGVTIGKAVSAPPHGRAVDADALVKVLKKKAENPLNNETTPYSWAFAYECLADVVKAMPTVLEAEEGE